MKLTAARLGAVLGALVVVLLGWSVPVGSATGTSTPDGVDPIRALPADVDDFFFESFDADYYLSIDASGYAQTRVVETIVAVFPPQQNRGIIRAIPDEARGYPLNQRMLSVTDEQGDPVVWEQYETSYYDSASDSYVPFIEYSLGTDEFVEGRTTYVLEYALDSTITRADVPGLPGGIDEFYWDVNGDGWAQSFDEVTARIHLTPELRAGLQGRTACYTGEYGSDERCSLMPTEFGFEATVAPVYPYSTVTVAVAFEPGTVVQRVRPQESWIVQLAPKALFGIVVALIVTAIVVRLVRWRGPRRGIIIAQYDPPEQDVLVSAQIIDRPGRGLPALLIDLAVRGMLRIVDTAAGAGSTKGPLNRFQLELLDASAASPRESTVLRLIFGKRATAGKKVDPGAFDAKTGAALFALTADTARAMSKDGYRRMPGDRLPKTLRRVGAAALVLFIPIWVWAFWNGVPDTGPITLFMWLSVAAWVGLAIALVRPTVLTERGGQLRDQLEGMRLYLTVAEEERLRVLQSPEGAQRRIDPGDRDAVVQLYERLLPYAVLWGLEREWVEKLRVRYPEAAPTWVSGGSLDVSFVTSFTTSAISKVQPAAQSYSSGSGGGSSWSGSGGSSFSGGSFGGGFSGGGGGGGGGGGR